MSSVHYQRTGHLAHIELDRPAQQNRFTMAMLGSMGQMFADADADPEVRCVLVTGRGADFCAGAETAEVVPAWASGKNPFGIGQINPMGVTGPRRTKPLVAVVQGACMNGGLELALASDVCIAADSVRFAFEEIRFGTYPFAGGLFRFIRAAGWSSAMRYVLTGDEFGAAEALRMQIVAEVRPADEASRAGVELATRISEAAPLALQAALGQAQAWADGGDVAGFARSIPDILMLLNSRDSAEALRARMQGRAPTFIGR